MGDKVAGIDVHKKVLMGGVYEGRDPKPEPERRRYGTTTSQLRCLSAWLREQGVHEAVMESTAQYWRPVWYELEPYMRLNLAQAFQPGTAGAQARLSRRPTARAAVSGGGVDAELRAGA